MRFTDCVKIIKMGNPEATRQECILDGVSFTVTKAVAREQGGYQDSGNATLRVPTNGMTDIECGDLVCRVGDDLCFVVTEVRDNRKCGSGLSHWKVICRC
ncbi:MAG: hypothetical protein E7414_05855 [Ruminococcaceae bacterium]|nr:hypothetical protein [Oscillospiraceae bacterium]